MPQRTTFSRIKYKNECAFICFPVYCNDYKYKHHCLTADAASATTIAHSASAKTIALRLYGFLSCHWSSSTFDVLCGDKDFAANDYKIRINYKIIIFNKNNQIMSDF